MDDKKNQEIKVNNDYDCPICLFIISEPIRLNCTHIICLGCLEKLLISLSKKCPLCRNGFQEANITFDNQFFRKTFLSSPDQLLDRLEKIYLDRLGKKGFLELSIAYGNEHEFVETEPSCKHKWKVFARLEKSNGSLKSYLDKFKLNAYSNLYFEQVQNQDNLKLKKVLNLMIQKDEKEAEFNNINTEEIDIIKKVTFSLHPTFNPSEVTIEQKPFEIQRKGWGTFNIPICIEFKDNLKIQTLNVDVDLCFNRPIQKKLQPIWIEALLD